MESIKGEVVRILFRNGMSGYTVAILKPQNQSSVHIVGSMPTVADGSMVTVRGEWKMDKKYGRQFAVSECEEAPPITEESLVRYLGSGQVKEIGPELAKRIVKKFGKDAIDVLDNNPEALLEVRGIGKAKLKKLIESWKQQRAVRTLMLFLQSHGVSPSYANRIFKEYGDHGVKVIMENPYRLADDIWGIGFQTADQIAMQLGFGKEAFVRLGSGIIYTLNQLSNDGHCYALRDQLLAKGAKLLDADASLLSITLDQMVKDNDVVRESVDGVDADGNPQTVIYLCSLFISELGTAQRLSDICGNNGVRIETKGLEERISRDTGMTYDSVQMEAILKAVQSKFMVLTGGPGTGKTTTTLGIISAFRTARAHILLAAPTGRAAKRLSEATGLEAKTIHRLLEFKPRLGFQKDEYNRLSGDVLIVDECSMVDIALMYNLLKAIPDDMTVILVGDVDQLPSVGAGNVLRDIIESGVFPVVRLTKIFRQAQTSRIITNAHRINQGEMPETSNEADTDFFFVEQGNDELVVNKIVDLMGTRLPKFYNLQPSQIQVLAPMRRGTVGTINLNAKLQAALNPHGDGIKLGNTEYRVGDKVMQIRNNYDKNVFNGDIGFVQFIDDTSREVAVSFSGALVRYNFSELDELMLAYATTIHKAQGSEFPVVVMPIVMSQRNMLQRNLLYTGVTRAKKSIVIVGTREAVGTAVRNMTINKRNTRLAERIRSFASVS